MTAAVRMMRENMNLIDIVIEILDARIPGSSRNPDIDDLSKGKSRLVILNKKDYADEAVTKQWERFYKDKGYFTAVIDARNRSDVNKTLSIIRTACDEKIKRDRAKGIMNRPVKAMICGIPNSGKSTYINSLSGKASAKTGNKPGVTKGKQWIRFGEGVQLLDTPGILWPKFEDQTVGMNLAICGSINDNILEPRDLALHLIDYLQKYYCNMLLQRYKLNGDKEPYELLNDIAVNKGCLKSKGEPDLDRAAVMLLNDFRACKIGRISLERPEM